MIEPVEVNKLNEAKNVLIQIGLRYIIGRCVMQKTRRAQKFAYKPSSHTTSI